MILLTSIQTLELVLAQAITTTEPTFVTNYINESTTTFALGAIGSTDGALNDTTPVTATAAPSAGFVRRISGISIFNNDTVAVVLTIQINDNGTTRTIWKGLLFDGDTLYYTDLRGFYIINNLGELRVNISNLPVSSGGGSSTVPLHAPTHETGGDDQLSLSAIVGNLASAAQLAITQLGTIVTGIWNATKIGLAYGGTNADLSATGGAHKFLRQNSSGAAVDVVQPASSDLSDASNIPLINAFNVFTNNNDIQGNFRCWTTQNFSRATRAKNTVYQAASDGFFYGYFQSLNAGVEYFRILVDGSNPPTTVRLIIGQQPFGEYLSFCCPIIKGEYYKIDETSSGANLAAGWWTPNGTNG